MQQRLANCLSLGLPDYFAGHPEFEKLGLA
jgi:hypothetical protein